MSQEITDLDASGVLAAPKRIRLHGVEYTLPGDVPAPLYVQLIGAADRPDDKDLTKDIYREVLALFRVYQPDLESVPLGLNEMTRVIGVIYSGQAVVTDGGDEEGPTTRKRSSTKTRARSRSRSST